MKTRANNSTRVCVSVCMCVRVWALGGGGFLQERTGEKKEVQSVDWFEKLKNKTSPMHACYKSKQIDPFCTKASESFFLLLLLRLWKKGFFLNKHPLTHRCHFVPAGSSHWKTKRARKALQRQDAAAHDQRSPHPHCRREPCWCTQRLVTAEGCAVRNAGSHTASGSRETSP